MSKSALLLIAFVGLSLTLCEPCAAQRYQSPSGPTLSPYLQYFRRDTGILDRYNAFVAPRQRLRQEFSNIEGQLRQQRLYAYGLESQLQGVATDLEGQQQRLLRPSGAAPTGVGATYMNIQGFNPGVATGGGFGGGIGGFGGSGATSYRSSRSFGRSGGLGGGGVGVGIGR